MEQPATAGVLRRAGEQALASGHAYLDHRALERACANDGLGHDEVFAALRALDAERLVDVRFVEPSQVTLLRLTDAGVRAALGDGSVDWRSGPVDLGAELGLPALVVETALEDLRGDGRAVFSRTIGGRLRIHRLE